MEYLQKEIESIDLILKKIEGTTNMAQINISHLNDMC